MTILPHFIQNHQRVFVKGRNISTTIRQIDDIIIHESNKGSQIIVLSLDFSKAFGTSTSLQALEKFGFSNNLKSWIKILMTDCQASVKNTGIYSEYFYLERGMSMFPIAFHHCRGNANNKHLPRK